MSIIISVCCFWHTIWEITHAFDAFGQMILDALFTAYNIHALCLFPYKITYLHSSFDNFFGFESHMVYNLYHIIWFLKVNLILCLNFCYSFEILFLQVSFITRLIQIYKLKATIPFLISLQLMVLICSTKRQSSNFVTLKFSALATNDAPQNLNSLLGHLGQEQA